jgi:hypothetical protein
MWDFLAKEEDIWFNLAQAFGQQKRGQKAFGPLQERFHAMPLPQKNRIYGALFAVIQPKEHGPSFGQEAFDKTATGAQIAEAIRRYLFPQLTNLTSAQHSALFGHLFAVMKPEKHWLGFGEDAFHGRKGAQATHAQVTEALSLTLSSTATS